jgi:hydrogenase/urease nickel incorporation metallochaperone HypA
VHRATFKVKPIPSLCLTNWLWIVSYDPAGQCPAGVSMHELAISEAIVNQVCDHVDGARIQRIVIEVGRLAGVMPDAIRFSFDIASRDTLADGATLEIEITDGQELRIRCVEVT